MKGEPTSDTKLHIYDINHIYTKLINTELTKFRKIITGNHFTFIDK